MTLTRHSTCILTGLMMAIIEPQNSRSIRKVTPVEKTTMQKLCREYDIVVITLILQVVEHPGAFVLAVGGFGRLVSL